MQVEIEGKIVDVYVLKRPHMDHFMASIGGHFEIIVFTASLSKYADPLLDLLDKPGVVRWRLFRRVVLSRVETTCASMEGTASRVNISCNDSATQGVLSPL